MKNKKIQIQTFIFIHINLIACKQTLKSTSNERLKPETCKFKFFVYHIESRRCRKNLIWYWNILLQTVKIYSSCQYILTYEQRRSQYYTNQVSARGHSTLPDIRLKASLCYRDMEIIIYVEDKSIIFRLRSRLNFRIWFLSFFNDANTIFDEYQTILMSLL